MLLALVNYILSDNTTIPAGLDHILENLDIKVLLIKQVDDFINGSSPSPPPNFLQGHDQGDHQHALDTIFAERTFRCPRPLLILLLRPIASVVDG